MVPTADGAPIVIVKWRISLKSASEIALPLPGEPSVLESTRSTPWFKLDELEATVVPCVAVRVAVVSPGPIDVGLTLPPVPTLELNPGTHPAVTALVAYWAEDSPPVPNAESIMHIPNVASARAGVVKPASKTAP